MPKRIFLLGLLVTTPAAADSESNRAIQHGAIDVNPVAIVVDQYGGQAQVAIGGPMTVVLGASYMTLDSTRTAHPDHGTSGGPGVRGGLFELGVRFHFPLSNDKPLVFAYVQPSLALDVLAVDGLSRPVPRIGGILDFGLHFGRGPGLFATVGLGVISRSEIDAIKSTGFLPSVGQRGWVSPRFLCSIGWAF
ncbi:MAG TPA: hypothetical protein VM925_25080 [Labilithrix sp.]|jgi:hypothetical protein|nr:hypothetical protein [Labilithrix sp.]